MPAIGRNDPCPCGSGKKYKRCCLGKEEQQNTFVRELEQYGLPLMRELGRYATERAESRPETIAAERFPFWRPPLDRMRASRLLDYLIFDYRPASYGRSAAEEYLAQRGPILAPRWRELLAAWQKVTMRLYVLEGWSAGMACCRQILPEAEQTIEVMPLERPEARIAAQSPVALRPLFIGGLAVYGSWPITFPGRSVEDVRASMITRHHAFVRSQRIVGLEEFLAIDGTVFDEEAAASSASKILIPGRS
jgi:hypothetical protein